MDNHRNVLVEANSSDQDEEETATSEEEEQVQGHTTRQSHAPRLPPLSFEPTDGHESSSTSLSDIIEGLPLAVKSSLGPLRTIRRSVSIRGWASYFYEISTSSRTEHMGNTKSREQRAEARQCHSHSIAVSTSTTTSVEMQQQQQQQNSRNQRRRAGHSTTRSGSKWAKQKATTSTEVFEYREPVPQKSSIDRFCGLQGKEQPSAFLGHQTTPSTASTQCCSCWLTCATVGQLLVNNALSSENHSPTAQLNDRRAYVQGVAWLLQGLPEDLDAHERNELVRAMPDSLLEEMEIERHGAASSTHSQQLTRRQRSPPATPPHQPIEPFDDRSLVHRTVAAVVVQLMLPLQVFWAYFMILLSRAFYLERKYKVTEQVVKHSGELGYTMGKRGVKLTGTIYNNGGSKVGQGLLYVADGLVKGIRDGIQEACWHDED